MATKQNPARTIKVAHQDVIGYGAYQNGRILDRTNNKKFIRHDAMARVLERLIVHQDRESYMADIAKSIFPDEFYPTYENALACYDIDGGDLNHRPVYCWGNRLKYKKDGRHFGLPVASTNLIFKYLAKEGVLQPRTLTRLKSRVRDICAEAYIGGIAQADLRAILADETTEGSSAAMNLAAERMEDANEDTEDLFWPNKVEVAEDEEQVEAFYEQVEAANEQVEAADEQVEAARLAFGLGLEAADEQVKEDEESRANLEANLEAAAAIFEGNDPLFQAYYRNEMLNLAYDPNAISLDPVLEHHSRVNYQAYQAAKWLIKESSALEALTPVPILMIESAEDEEGSP
jgi:hypothetical protein